MVKMHEALNILADSCGLPTNPFSAYQLADLALVTTAHFFRVTLPLVWKVAVDKNKMIKMDNDIRGGETVNDWLFRKYLRLVESMTKASTWRLRPNAKIILKETMCGMGGSLDTAGAFTALSPSCFQAGTPVTVVEV